jgi:dUTP pyrophosphatase
MTPQQIFLKRMMREAARAELDTVPVPVVGFKRLRPDENDLPLPSYQTPGAVAMDIQACLPEREYPCPKCHSDYEGPQVECGVCRSTGKKKVRNLTLNAGERIAVPTGFAVKLPPGYETQIRSRSGLSLKGVVVANSPGTIDWDYTGELRIILFNTTGTPFIIEHGMRIAQMAVTPVVQAAVEEIKDLPATERGDGGLGHTGV